MTLITLNYQECKALEQCVSHTKNAMHLRRAQASLRLDGGESVLAVADRLPNGYHVIQLKHLICFCDRSGSRIVSA